MVTNYLGWVHADQIFYTENKGFGVAENGATICLGDSTEIELYLKLGVNRGLSPLSIQILESIKNLEGKLNGNQHEIKRTGDIRSRPSRDFEHREGTTRRSPPTKRVVLRQAKLTQ